MFGCNCLIIMKSQCILLPKSSCSEFVDDEFCSCIEVQTAVWLGMRTSSKFGLACFSSGAPIGAPRSFWFWKKEESGCCDLARTDHSDVLDNFMWRLMSGLLVAVDNALWTSATSMRKGRLLSDYTEQSLLRICNPDATRDWVDCTYAHTVVSRGTMSSEV